MKTYRLIAFLILAASPLGAADELLLADGGKALLPIVVSEQAAAATKDAAAELADYLQRISGAKFEVRT